MAGIYTPLTDDERRLLLRMAKDECRDPREQLRYLFRQAARSRGLLETEQARNKEDKEEAAAVNSGRQRVLGF